MTIGRIPSVEGGIQPTIVDAKGDLIAAVAADSVNRLAVGSNDQVLVADSSTSTGLAWKSYGAQFVAGKNKIINGDFGVWQRGTSFSLGNGTTYSADRFRTYRDGTGATVTVSRQAFTLGTAPVAGYESQYFLRYDQSVAGSGATYSALAQSIEDVRTFAGQTVTFSFWAKANSSRNVNVSMVQDFGAGGSAAVYPAAIGGNAVALTTSWQRFSVAFNINSITGKTIGTNSYLQAYFDMPLNTTYTIDTWGWQLEAGSVATPFTTATGTIQGELAACQRYYWRISSSDTGQTTNFLGFANGYATSTTNGRFTIYPPATLRTGPTALDYSQLVMADGAGGAFNPTAVAIDTSARTVLTVNFTTTGLTQFRPYALIVNGSTTAYLAFSAEL